MENSNDCNKKSQSKEIITSIQRILNELIKKCQVPASLTFVNDHISVISTFVKYDNCDLLKYVIEDKLVEITHGPIFTYIEDNKNPYNYLFPIEGGTIDIFDDGIYVTIINRDYEKNDEIISKPYKDLFEIICNLYHIFNIDSKYIVKGTHTVELIDWEGSK